jgi:hypothetical protein
MLQLIVFGCPDLFYILQTFILISFYTFRNFFRYSLYGKTSVLLQPSIVNYEYKTLFSVYTTPP